MNLGGGGEEDEVISAINTTPLVDVMLVLLIIFLITIPVVNTSVAVSLPKERNELRVSKPEDVVISVDAKGGLFLYDQRVATTAALTEELRKVAARVPQPEVHIRGDRLAVYGDVGRAVSAARQAGIAKVAFIVEPPPLQ